MDLKRMDALIESWQGEIFEKMKSWIAIESIGTEPTGEGRPFGDNVRKSLDLFLKDASEMGFDTYDCDGYAGHAQYGGGDRTMGILAHLDIVPLGEGWTHDPLGAEIVDGKCFGRGVIDDKGPLLGAMYALRAVKESGIKLRDGVRIIAGCDEETGMSDMRYYASKLKMPDYGFSPDAEYPLINIEKGGLTLKLTAALAEDSAAIKVLGINAGERINVVPNSAVATVSGIDIETLKAALSDIAARHDKFELSCNQLDGGDIQITATGVGAHAAMPYLGVNAAGMLLVALGELGAPAPIAGLAKLIGEDSSGEALGIAISDELSGALTCNLGLLRFVGGAIEAYLDIRYPIAASEEKMCGQAAMAISEHGIALTRVGGRAPLHVPAESAVVSGLLEVYREQTGLDAYPIAIGGGTYSKMMPNTVAFGINFPGDDDTCHMPDEYVFVDKFMLSVKIMAHAIVRLAGE